MIARLNEVPVWQRTQNWIDEMRKLAARQPRRYPSLAAASRRMREENRFLSEEQASHLTSRRAAQRGWHLLVEVRQTTCARSRLSLGQRGGARAVGAHHLPCVVAARNEELGERPRARRAPRGVSQRALRGNVEGAGHWVHHDRLTEFLALMRDFLGAANEPSRPTPRSPPPMTPQRVTPRPAPRASDAVPPQRANSTAPALDPATTPERADAWRARRLGAERAVASHSERAATTPADAPRVSVMGVDGFGRTRGLGAAFDFERQPERHARAAPGICVRP